MSPLQDNHDHTNGNGAQIEHSSLNKDDGTNPHDTKIEDVSEGIVKIKDGNVGIGTTTPKSLLEIRKDVTGELGPVLTLQNGFGSGGAGAAIDFNGYDVKENDPSARIQSLDDNNASSHVVFYTKKSGPPTNKLEERLRIQSDGNVGIGTSSPNFQLDVQGIINTTEPYYKNGEPWKITDDDINDEGISGNRIKDNSISENKLTFDISPGETFWEQTSNNNISYSSGDVGIGTSTPKAKLHIYERDTGGQGEGGSIKFFDKEAEFKYEVSYDGGSDGKFAFTNTGIPEGETRFQSLATGLTLLNIKNNGEVHGEFHGEFHGKQVESSSRELKENITDFSTQEAIEAFANLKPVKFNYREDKQKKLKAGFIAEDVPELVASADRKGVCVLDIVAVLTKVIQEQQQELRSLKERLNALEAYI